MGYVFSFNRNKAWEQHVAGDCPSDVVGIANDCGIPKAFAMYGATAEFGIEPLLCTESHIRSVKHSDSQELILQPAMQCTEVVKASC